MVTGVQFVEFVTAKTAQITRAGLLKFSLLQILFAVFFLVITITSAFSEGRIYEGNEDKAHCTLWDTQRLRWPQTSIGREKTKCRRRALPPTVISKVCRLKRVGKDKETGQKLCIYSAQGRGDSDVTVPISPSLSCQRTYSCKYDD
jgi:hypothetical protein